MNDTETETLIALVASLLPQNGPNTTPEAIIEALLLSDGDVGVAANTLKSNLSQLSKASRMKRKHADLESWLMPPSKSKQKTIENESNDPSSSSITRQSTSRKPMKPASTSNPPVDLMSVLRQPSSPQKVLPRLPPMLLSNPQMISEHTPCTLHLSILPPELACRLFYTMVGASKAWKRNKWWLFDRVVESPHLTSFFARRTDGLDSNETWQEAAQYWYNGRMTDPPSAFPAEMEEACMIVEKMVNEEIRKRQKRFKLEWGGTKGGDPSWRANVAASNCYQGGKESVGFHSDQLTYLGPYPTIASLSLGTRRNFSLREVIPTDQISARKAQTFNIPLPHNSLTIMHASCQERFKHSIPPQSAVDIFRPVFPQSHGEIDSIPTEPSNCRINITFRFYRPDFRPPSIPRCLCGIPTILRPDMKNRNEEETDRYWWTCYAGAQNDGKGCNFWKVLSMEEEGRGPCIGISEGATYDGSTGTQ